jgi:hypothetical protein
MPEVMDVSEAKLAANRANAELSTGPRSLEGKGRSSLNAMKHGLTGRTVMLPKEDKEVYRAFCVRMVTSLKPETPKEEELAQLVADQHWRLRRIKTVEDALEERGEVTVQELATLGTYQQRIHRVLKDAEQRLEEMQALRRRGEAARNLEAIRLYKLHKMLEMAWHPEEFGFDYAEAEMERRVREQIVRAAAIEGARWSYDRARIEAWMREKEKSEV